MANMNGFAKVSRQLLFDPDIKPRDRIILAYLTVIANYEYGNSNGIEVAPGQVIVGRTSIAENTGYTESQVRTSMQRLQKTNLIKTKPVCSLTGKSPNKSPRNGTLVTIVNYGKYTYSEDEINQKKDQKLAENRTLIDNGINQIFSKESPL